MNGNVNQAPVAHLSDGKRHVGSLLERFTGFLVLTSGAGFESQVMADVSLPSTLMSPPGNAFGRGDILSTEGTLFLWRYKVVYGDGV